MRYHEMQQIARKTISYIKTVIRPGMSLVDIRALCEEKMLELGADSFWYWDVGAFIFSGKETAISVSGKEYTTSRRQLEADDIITIDLSPSRGGIWGDYARTIVMEKGKVVEAISEIENAEWRNGLLMEERLHQELLAFATPQTTFEELYLHINRLIQAEKFINLDFMGNLGHSIAASKDERIYIEKGNRRRLSSVNYFTFEPHIGLPHSPYGYKKENIYYFCAGSLLAL